MVRKEDIEQIAGEALTAMGREELFVVAVDVNGDRVEVTIDSDSREKGVEVDSCADLSRTLRDRLGNEVADELSITVLSAGIGQPLQVERQYKKLVGKSIEVVLKDGGTKIIGTLKNFADNNLTLVYMEGKKKADRHEVEKTFPIDTIKTTREILDYK